MSNARKLAILVGGGPAPGINSVIGAATIRGVLEGVEVLGVLLLVTFIPGLSLALPALL